MGCFDNKKNVIDYIRMTKGYDGEELVYKLEKHLKPGSTVLELGMGPGKDFDLLKKKYTATGSDSSQVFLDLYRETHPTEDIIKLDAVTLTTDRQFDCIYSNKVLHHLTKTELAKSFHRQLKVLNSGGIIFHTFWKGDGEETFSGLLFTYYNIDTLLDIVPKEFKLLEGSFYKEMKKNDSIVVVMRKL